MTYSKSIDDTRYIRVPGISLFNENGLNRWLGSIPIATSVNLSLLLNKNPYWFDDGLGPTLHKKKGPDYKKELLQHISRLSRLMPSEYGQLLNRHYAAPDGYQPVMNDWTTKTRLIVGFSDTTSVFEVGFTLHPYYGFPIVPASEIKGVTSHYFEEVRKGKEAEYPETWRDIFAGKPIDGVKSEGAVVFYDAWPVNLPVGKPLLELDVFTPHYGAYYNNPGSPPSDDLSPIPIIFLAVPKGVSFRFAVRPSVCTSKPKLASAAISLIKEAITTFGIGAKTDSSYGYFR